MAIPPSFETVFSLLPTMAPLLTLAGGAALVIAAVSSLWLPGRRRVKLGILSATAVVWVGEFMLLVEPGLIELP